MKTLSKENQDLNKILKNMGERLSAIEKNAECVESHATAVLIAFRLL